MEGRTVRGSYPDETFRVTMKCRGSEGRGRHQPLSIAAWVILRGERIRLVSAVDLATESDDMLDRVLWDQEANVYRLTCPRCGCNLHRSWSWLVRVVSGAWHAGIAELDIASLDRPVR